MCRTRRRRGRYRVAAESGAFSGWTVAGIHEALNEVAPSARTSVVLERVGGVLRARERTGPDDDPLVRSQRRQGFERGRAEGLIAGVQRAQSSKTARSSDIPMDMTTWSRSWITC